jgi:MFS family permease
LLQDLHFSYAAFTLTSIAFVVTQAVTLHNWGKVGDRFGNRRVLALTGLALPFIPMLWLLSTHLAWIVLFQALSGVVWGGFLLSLTNFIFDAVTPAKRARCVAYYNTVTSAGILAGAVVGGWLTPRLPTDLSVLGYHVRLASHFQALFLLSGLGRLVVSVCLLPVIREVRPVEPSTSWQVMIQVVGLAPIRGARIGVFTGVHPSEIPPPPTEPARVSRTAPAGEGSSGQENRTPPRARGVG